jgi:hypothetical protein
MKIWYVYTIKLYNNYKDPNIFQEFPRETPQSNNFQPQDLSQKILQDAFQPIICIIPLVGYIDQPEKA